jgi:probable rRNA maturation factor
MELDYSNETKENLDIYYEKYLNIFKNTLLELKKNDNYICSVTFVDKDKIHEINKDYRKIDRPTDVISFAFLDDTQEMIKGDVPIDLGEIYICYDVALENAKSYGNTINRELCFLFVHGLLHLFGYNHITKEDENIMFPLQEKILERK